MRCSTSLLRTSAEGQLGADQRDVLALAEQVGNPADVVLVGVGEDDGLDVAQPVLDGGEVGQDQVDAGLVGLGEQNPAVHDEQPPGVLEDRHVPADLAETAERDYAQAVPGQSGRGAESGVRMAHVSFTPPASRSSRSCCISAAVASASGRRTGPPGRPSIDSAAFVVITP